MDCGSGPGTERSRDIENEPNHDDWRRTELAREKPGWAGQSGSIIRSEIPSYTGERRDEIEYEVLDIRLLPEPSLLPLHRSQPTH